MTAWQATVMLYSFISFSRVLKKGNIRSAGTLPAETVSIKSMTYACRQGWQRYVFDFFNTLLGLTGKNLEKY